MIKALLSCGSKIQKKRGEENMILAVTNQKGGVGKTTTCLNLGAMAALDGRRTCLVDLDPQGNLTKTFVQLEENDLTIYDMLNHETPFPEILRPTPQANLSLIPANTELAGLERECANDPQLAYRLRERLHPYTEQFDLIIIDTPPTLGALTVNAMTAATHLLIPIQSSFYCLHGTNDLLQTYHLVKSKLNPELTLLGILITLFDPRTTLAKEVVEEIKRTFGSKVCKSVISKCVKLEESPAQGHSIFTYAPKSAAARQYEAAYLELIGHD
jgi:chromosome partitioning protein